MREPIKKPSGHYRIEAGCSQLMPHWGVGIKLERTQITSMSIHELFHLLVVSDMCDEVQSAWNPMLTALGWQAGGLMSLCRVLNVARSTSLSHSPSLSLSLSLSRARALTHSLSHSAQHVPRGSGHDTRELMIRESGNANRSFACII